MDQPPHSGSESPSEMHVRWRTDGAYEISVLCDLSPEGAFIRTERPAEPGTILHLLLDVSGNLIHAQAVVRRALPGQGMGVEFQPMSKVDRERLERFLGAVAPLAQADTRKSPGKLRESPAAARPAPRGKAAEKPRDSPAASSRSRHPERRAHLRHKVTAEVDIVETASGQFTKGHLVDLGRTGCYVKTDSAFAVGTAVELSITQNTQSFLVRARVVYALPGEGMGFSFTGVQPDQEAVLNQWLASSLEASWLASNRRKSHRVLLHLPVQVAGTNSIGAEFAEETETISVSAHGALLLLSTALAKGQSLTLWNRRTDAALECSVVYLGQPQEARREVGVSFTLPNRMFWQVAFPPGDWSPRDPYAKGA